MSIRCIILSILLSSCINLQLDSQQTNSILDLPNSSLTVSELLLIIESQTDYNFSYNPQQIPLNKKLKIAGTQNSLKDIIASIEEQSNVSIDINEILKRIVILPPATFNISAFVLDSISGECLIGAMILADHKFIASTNNNGYFNVNLDYNKPLITIYNIGYNQRVYVANPYESDSLIITLIPKLDLNIIITPEKDHLINTNEYIDLGNINNHFGTAGTNDLVQQIKFSPGVSSGAEGQNGFNVRGGGPHQNLILIDDMPIYESSHLGGLSSIFLPSSIKSTRFIKSAFPARYGGRLSSVLDVRLKDGNKNNYSRELSLGLEGITGHIDGPIGTNTSVNLNLRASWFSAIASPFVKAITNVQDLSFRYNDSYSKITHWFTNTSKLSLSAYWGDDLVKTARSEFDDDNIGFQDYNRISWGNRFISLKWDKLLNEKWHLQTNIGRSDYNYRSRGSFNRSYLDMDTIAFNAFDILSISELRNYVANVELDYYSPNTGQYKFGINYTNHSNSPTIIESRTFVNEAEDPVITDTSYVADELALFVQNKFPLSSKVNFTTGIRGSLYTTNESNYFFLEPRLLLSYEHENHQLNFSYSRVSQFIHLLSNPGLGLPSDLWVPSTSNVPPEISNIFSIDYYRKKQNRSFGLSLWYKTFDNIIEYSNPSIIIYSLIINNELYQVEVDNSSWESRISFGKGHAFGFESFAQGTIGSFDLNVNYAYTRTLRVIGSIDGGSAFPYKFDSPHNISAQIKYRVNNHNSLVLNWQFASGTAYTLLDTQRLGTDGEPVLIPSSRNNFRLPDFHHLDIHYRLEKKLKGGRLIYDIGIYNIYNRLNAFYEYLSQDTPQGSPELIKVSIYPILPQFNISYIW